MYINIDFQLLHEELYRLGRLAEGGTTWQRYAPSKRDVDILFRNFYTVEFCENFYDSEPNYDTDIYNAYLDYRAKVPTNDPVTGVDFFECVVASEEEKTSFSRKDLSTEEMRKAYNTICKKRREYNKKRITFCNWQEPYMEGNWQQTQEATDAYAKNALLDVRAIPVHKRDRLWMLDVSNDERVIYYYGRDFLEVDFVWSMKRRATK